MKTPSEYPENSQHQAPLEALTAHYADDPRILAVVLFGSLARENWDRYSDLDLDVVIAEGVEIDVIDEAERLGASFSRIDEHVALIVPDGWDAVDIVLSSLLGLSIRYHPLDTTSPRQAIEALHRMRSLVMELFARAHNGVRSVSVFEAQAETDVQSRLGATLPQYDLGPIQAALT